LWSPDDGSLQPAAALKLYQAGADYVLLPNMVAGNHPVPIVEHLLREESVNLKEEEMKKLREREEIL